MKTNHPIDVELLVLFVALFAIGIAFGFIIGRLAKEKRNPTRKIIVKDQLNPYISKELAILQKRLYEVKCQLFAKAHAGLQDARYAHCKAIANLMHDNIKGFGADKIMDPNSIERELERMVDAIYYERIDELAEFNKDAPRPYIINEQLILEEPYKDIQEQLSLIAGRLMRVTEQLGGNPYDILDRELS